MPIQNYGRGEQKMINSILEMFSYDFIIRGIIVGALVSLCSALLGVSLVLKRYSMIGDGLSHVGFGALAVSAALGASPLAVSIPVVVIAAFFLLRINTGAKLKGDAAVAIVSTTALAFGVLVVSLTTGMNTDVYNYMFGSILAMNQEDVILSLILSIIVIVLFVVFYNKIFAVTFDENFAKATGTNTSFLNMLIAVLASVTIVLGMRMMGALLISALIIFPALTSMRIFKTFKSVVICSALVSLFCFFTGFTLSFLCDTPAGATIVAANAVLFCIFLMIEKLFQRTISFNI